MIRKVAGTTTALMFILLGLLGFGNLGMAFDYSIASYAFWFHIVIGILLLFIAWALYKVVSDFERLTNRYLDAIQEMGYVDLDDYFNKSRLKQIPDTGKEKSSLLKAMSDSDLLELKKKYKSNKSVVKIIDDVLETRARAIKND